MGLVGTAIGGAIGGFGKKPIIPDVEYIDAKKLQKQTIQDNSAILGQAQQLAARQNTFNAGQVRAMMEQVLGANFGVAEGIMGDQLRGVVPQDVQDQIQNSAAARSLSLGGGGGLTRNLTMRDLGLTSLQQQQQGLSTMFGFGQMLKTPMADASSMFLSPMQRIAQQTNERDTRFNRDLLANQVAAAPDPFKAAMTQAIIQEEDRIGELVGSVAGAAASGGGM